MVDLVKNDTELNEFELAPTDILTSLNRNEIFESERFVDLLMMFRIFTLNMSLMRPRQADYVELAKQINATGYKKALQVATPVEFLHVHKPKYLDLLKRNLMALMESLEGHLEEVNLQINFDKRFIGHRDLNAPSIDKLFDILHGLDLGTTTKINFVFPHGRRPRDTEFLKEDMIESLHEVNRLYMRHLKRRGKDAHIFHVPYQLYDYACGGEGTWFKGEMYVRPLINERYTMFSENIRLKGDWTHDNFIMFNQELTNLYLEKGEQMPDCRDCPHLMLCADRGVQEVMEWAGTDRCIMLLKDYGDLRVPLMNGQFDKIDWDAIEC